MNIEVTLRPGIKEVAYFADITIDSKLNILGCAVFTRLNHPVRVAMPSRKSEEGHHYPSVTLSPSLSAAVEAAVQDELSRREGRS